MKFLYPIKKLNIKPWIKYWILKGNKVLSEVIEGTTPITIEKAYEGTTLQELAFKGQTIQNRVVKEDNYININEESYRVDLGGKNKFNYQYSNLRNINRVTTSEETNGFKLTSTGVAGYGFASLPIENNLLGKQVTISCNSSGNKAPSARLFYHNSSGSLASNIGAFWTTNTAHTVTLPSTLPSGSTGIDIVFYISQGNNASGDYATFTDIQIEEGSIATAYSPYVANPIELSENDKLWNDEGIWRLNNSEITSTNLIEQLETIKNATLISGTNEITQLPSDLPFILNFKYYMKG